MLATLINKEILEYLRSQRFIIGMTLMAVVVIASVLLLGADVTQRIEGQEMMERITEEYLSNYAHLNRIGYFMQPARPIETSEALFRGVRDNTTATSFFAGSLQHLFEELDLLFVFSIFLSLLALTLTHDAVCGERENGTLKLVHTQPVSRFTVIFGKWLGAMVVLSIPFLLVLNAALLLSNIFGGMPLTLAAITEVELIGLAGIFYAGTFAALGLFISALSRGSSTAILACLLSWVMFVLAIPNLSPLLASQLSPIPSVNEVERQARQLTDTLRDERVNEATRALEQDFRKEFQLPETITRLSQQEEYRRHGYSAEQASDLADEWNNRWRAVLDRVNAEQNAKADALRAELNRKIDAQRSLSRFLSLLSPSAAFVYYGTDIASVGLRAEEYITEEMNEYSRAFNAFVEQRREEEEERLGRAISFEEYIDLTQRPRFQHKPEPIGDRLNAVMPYAAHLAISMIILLALTTVAYLRYDVR